MQFSYLYFFSSLFFSLTVPTASNLRLLCPQDSFKQLWNIWGKDTVSRQVCNVNIWGASLPALCVTPVPEGLLSDRSLLITGQICRAEEGPALVWAMAPAPAARTKGCFQKKEIINFHCRERGTQAPSTPSPGSNTSSQLVGTEDKQTPQGHILGWSCKGVLTVPVPLLAYF